MQLSLKRIWVLALAASSGLILLQAYWLIHEWRIGKEIIQQQVNHALQEAVNEEAASRKDTLRQFLINLLSDNGYVKFSTYYNKELRTWTIKMADANNPRDFTNFSVNKIPVDSILTPEQRISVIRHLVMSAVDEQINRNTIKYYTQRFGNRWKEHFDSLQLNMEFLHNAFRQKLSQTGIQQSFHFLIYDTAGQKTRSDSSGFIISEPFPVHFNSVWENDNNFRVQAAVKNPFMVLLQRTWLALICTLLLVALTVGCLFKMYRIIRNQKQLDQMKNDFIDNMTHELKTPIATIHAAIDSLQYFKGLQSEERTMRYLNTSRKELARLNNIVVRIMQTAVYETQSMPLHRENMQLVPVVLEIANSLQLQYKSAFTITAYADPDNLSVHADKIHFTNALKNILENAIRYVPNNLEVTVEASGGNEFHTIMIRDNGPGIPFSSQPFLFDKFYRVPAQNVHDVKGYGLGLFYVKQIILQHGGDISVKSKPGNGATFIIKLPATPYVS